MAVRLCTSSTNIRTAVRSGTLSFAGVTIVARARSTSDG
jgi:hypothetical protein